MRRENWILVSSVCMLALCALPYGCGGKAVDDTQVSDGVYVPPVSGDGASPGNGDGFYVAGRSVGHYVQGDGISPPCQTCDGYPIPPYGGDGGVYIHDGGPIPNYGAGADGDYFTNGYGAEEGDGTTPSGAIADGVIGDGAAPEGAANDWTQ